MQQNDIKIVVGLQPDTTGKLLNFHASHYIKEHGFGRIFESEVGRQLLDAIQRSEREPNKCNIVSAIANGSTIGAIVIDANEPGKEELGAHFRWFFVDPEFATAGVGPQLIEAAMTLVLKHKLLTKASQRPGKHLNGLASKSRARSSPKPKESPLTKNSGFGKPTALNSIRAGSR
jgi:hypothetical protein